VGATVRRLREESGESLFTAAAAVGLDRGFLRGVETGQRNVSLERLFDIADHFEVVPGELLHGVR
jgi:transcriptional regulator with XRE-family HTH domain